MENQLCFIWHDSKQSIWPQDEATMIRSGLCGTSTICRTTLVLLVNEVFITPAECLGSLFCHRFSLVLDQMPTVWWLRENYISLVGFDTFTCTEKIKPGVLLTVLSLFILPDLSLCTLMRRLCLRGMKRKLSNWRSGNIINSGLAVFWFVLGFFFLPDVQEYRLILQ